MHDSILLACFDLRLWNAVADILDCFGTRCGGEGTFVVCKRWDCCKDGTGSGGTTLAVAANKDALSDGGHRIKGGGSPMMLLLLLVACLCSSQPAGENSRRDTQLSRYRAPVPWCPFYAHFGVAKWRRRMRRPKSVPQPEIWKITARAILRLLARSWEHTKYSFFGVYYKDTRHTQAPYSLLTDTHPHTHTHTESLEQSLVKRTCTRHSSFYTVDSPPGANPQG